MRLTYFQLTVLLIMMLPLQLMADNAIGKDNPMSIAGKCTYKEIYGTATILKVSEADPAANNCKKAVEVIFSFTPDDLQAVKSYLFPKNTDQQQHLTVGAGMNPSRTWVEKQGLTVGSKHRCMRKEITHGACTPVLFVFPDIDYSDWQETCF